MPLYIGLVSMSVMLSIAGVIGIALVLATLAMGLVFRDELSQLFY